MTFDGHGNDEAYEEDCKVEEKSFDWNRRDKLTR